MARSKSLRYPVLVLSATALLTSGLAAGEPAQQIDEVIVTGSRIPRPDFQSASPIVTVDNEAFKRTVATSVESVLSRLPQFVPDFGSTSNNPGIGGRATVQLRGLGAQSTLVLLDGRRLIPATGEGAVDVNIIPPALLERVEVVSGGASAVYGSDAVAGVVNFKLKQDFEGVQVDGSWGQTDRDDGEEQSAGITAGTPFAEGRGHVYGYLGYTERDAVTQAEREFSGYPLSYFGPGAGRFGPDDGFLASGSGTIAEGRVSIRANPAAFTSLFAGYGYTPGTVPYQTNFAANADGTVFATGNRTPGSVANYRGPKDPVLFNDRVYTYNFAPWNYLQLPLERSSAFGRASFELASGTEVYAQALYAGYSADAALAPAPSSPSQAGPLYVSRDNPYIPADMNALLDARSDPGAELLLGKRWVEVGPRIASNDNTVYQATAGIRGDFARDWHYEAYAQYGDNDQREDQTGNVLRSRVFDLTRAPDGGRSICGEFNLFKVGAISPECAEYISVDASNSSGYKQAVAAISGTRPVWTLPAGALELAVGVMYKRDEYFYRADPIGTVFLADGRPDIQGFLASDDIEGSDHNTDFYVEASIPLLADRPGAQSLETLLGYRHTQYASAGGADAWKAELMYQPVDSMRLRGSLQRAVRAPSVYELYLPRLPTNYSSDPIFGVADPCAAGSAERSGPDAAQVEALCLAQGMPPSLLADFSPVDDYYGVSGGNTELEPETATTQTLGIVLSPAFEQEWLAQMQLGLDWYRIEVDDAIDNIDATTYIPACYDPVTNPGLAASGYWCGFLSRDGTTGQIVDIVDTLVNYSRREVSGVDLHLDWHIPAGPGTIGISALASWLDEFKLSPAHGLPPDERTGLVGGGVGGSQPEWKANIGLSYQWSAFTVGAQWRYIDAMHDADVNAGGWDYRVPSQDYSDLYLEGAFETGLFAGLTIRAGVENLSDEEPPLLPSAVAANTDPSQYDVLGRRYYLNFGYRF